MDRMSHELHRQRHVELHKALDELYADFISHHPRMGSYSERPLIELLRWSHEQTINPAEPVGSVGFEHQCDAASPRIPEEK